MATYKGSTIEGDLEGGIVYGMSGNELGARRSCSRPTRRRRMRSATGSR